jgi:hypothetical protein
MNDELERILQEAVVGFRYLPRLTRESREEA